MHFFSVLKFMCNFIIGLKSSYAVLIIESNIQGKFILWIETLPKFYKCIEISIQAYYWIEIVTVQVY